MLYVGTSVAGPRGAEQKQWGMGIAGVQGGVSSTLTGRVPHHSVAETWSLRGPAHTCSSRTCLRYHPREGTEQNETFPNLSKEK